MNLMERYLAAVGRDLPEAQRADIIAELRDELLSKVEEREATLGRPLERRELEALLVEFGHPLVVAGRYRKIQHLIGPEVFPFWWAGLRAALAIGAGVYLVLAILALISTGDLPQVIARAFPNLWEGFLITFAVVTLIAVGLEHGGRRGRLKRVLRWRPSELPPVRLKAKSRFELVVEIGLQAVFILWWTRTIELHSLVASDRQPSITLAPVWDAWYWPVLAYAMFDMGVSLVALLRPAWTRLNRGLYVLRYAAAAAILGGILQAGQWVVIADLGRTGGDLTAVQAHLDLAIRIGFTALIVIVASLAAINAWRFLQSLNGTEEANGGLSPTA